MDSTGSGVKGLHRLALLGQDVASDGIDSRTGNATGIASTGPEMRTIWPEFAQCPAAIGLPVAHHAVRLDTLSLNETVDMFGSDMQRNQPPLPLAANFEDGFENGLPIFQARQSKGRFLHQVAGKGFVGRSGHESAFVAVSAATRVSQQVSAIRAEGKEVAHPWFIVTHTALPRQPQGPCQL